VKISLARIITKRDRELFEMSRAVIADSRWNGGQQAGVLQSRRSAQFPARGLELRARL
jgi:hypothetical protein